MAGPTPSDGLLFDAVLRPHRSLSKPGFLILMGFIAVVSFASGMLFLLQGAWPVMGFFGLEVGLVYVAFKMNYRAGKLFETVQLDTSQLLVRRIDPKGRAASWSFQPNWLRVAMDDPPEHESQLTLTTHGRSLTIGAFLTPEERLQIAQELRAALAHWRKQPVI
ncbi:MAG: DUF2244 domain-containing protein [Alphaproteobacteria bacterium]|nr:DUF2244 domain-containing protein [Alphaproteobacteria bacterium]